MGGHTSAKGLLVGGRAVGIQNLNVLRARFSSRPDQRNQRESELTCALRPWGLSAPTKENKSGKLRPKPKKAWAHTHLCRAKRICARLQGLMAPAKCHSPTQRMPLHGRTPCALHHSPISSPSYPLFPHPAYVSCKRACNLFLAQAQS